MDDTKQVVKEVKLDRLWKIVFTVPRDVDGFEDDWNPDGSPIFGFYWIDVKLYDASEREPEEVFSGYLKADGCSNWKLDQCFHMCGPEDAKLFGIVFEEAHKLMRSDFVVQGEA